MIKNIFIRTNFNSNLGIGHYMRCKRLADEFSVKNVNCFFIFDNPLNEINFDFKFFSLYQNGSKFRSEIDDAKNFIYSIKDLDKGFVLVDDYRLGYLWQKEVSKSNKIIFIDDFNSKNFADYIINYSPEFFFNNKYKKKNEKKNSKFIIGSEYALFDKFSNIKREKSKKFILTFYFGGGFNFSKINSLINNLHNKDRWQFNFIIGPVAKNYTFLEKYCANKKNFKLFYNPKNLQNILLKSSLVISSAGTMMYNTSYLKIPSIIVNLGKFQKDNFNNLSKLNHNIFLNLNDLNKLEFIILLENLSLKTNSFSKIFPFNNIGLSQRSEKKIVDIILNNKKVKKIPNIKNKKIKKNYLIEKCNIQEINDYLVYRNKLFNRKYSSRSNVINKLDHYNWWIRSSRTSYILYKDGKKILYFFVEKIFNKNSPLISGWFSCVDKVDLKDLLFALRFKFNKYKENKLYSYVKKNNKFAIQFSKLIGWKKINDINKIRSITTFKKLRYNNFIFYEK